MKGKTFGLLAVVLAIFLGSSAHAARISGTYSGTVVAGRLRNDRYAQCEYGASRNASFRDL